MLSDAPGSSIFVNGKDVGRSPAQLNGFVAGWHSVRVEVGTARTPVQVLVAEHRRNEPMTAPFALATTVTPK